MRSLISYGFLAPLNILIALCLAGALLSLVWRRASIVVVLASSFSLYVFSTPALSSYLMWRIESKITESKTLNTAQAIVVLGVDARPGDGDLPDRLGPQSLERLFMTAESYRQLHLPVAVSGGPVFGSQVSLAELMKTGLERQFAVPVTWSEEYSRNTYENAAYTAKLLREANIGIVVVVAQAPDLPRIIWSFRRVEIQALPWPVIHTAPEVDQVEDFLPSTRSLAQSAYAIHELIGNLYYRVRY